METTSISYIVESLNTSVCLHSIKFMWPLNIMMWINGFERVAESCRAVVVNFLCVPESPGS